MLAASKVWNCISAERDNMCVNVICVNWCAQSTIAHSKDGNVEWIEQDAVSVELWILSHKARQNSDLITLY